MSVQPIPGYAEGTYKQMFEDACQQITKERQLWQQERSALHEEIERRNRTIERLMSEIRQREGHIHMLEKELQRT